MVFGEISSATTFSLNIGRKASGFVLQRAEIHWFKWAAVWAHCGIHLTLVVTPVWTLLPFIPSPKAPQNKAESCQAVFDEKSQFWNGLTYRNTLQPTALAESYLPKETLQSDPLAVWTVSHRRSGGLAPLLNHLLWADAVFGAQSCRWLPGLAPCASACLMETAWINNKNNRELSQCGLAEDLTHNTQDIFSGC